MTDIIRWLVEQGVPHSVEEKFSNLTTMKCGGNIALTVTPTRVSDLLLLINLLRKTGVRYMILGMGSNVVASEKPFDGVVVNLRKFKGIKRHGNTIVALAGTSTVAVYNVALQYNLAGSEFLSCLPATIGGAAVMNAGCFGQTMADIVESVLVVKDGKIMTFSNSDCCFSRRSSALSDCIVVAVKLKFTVCEGVKERAETMRQLKKDRQPLDMPSAGCVLYCADGGCIASMEADRLGFKGMRCGGAEVSNKHAGFVLNVDKARGEDIYYLVSLMLNTLREKTGCDIRTEVRFVGMP